MQVKPAAAQTNRMETLQITIEGEQAECVCAIGSQPPQQAGRALVVLSDIFGVRTEDTREVTSALVQATGTTAYVPDMFRGQPWRKEDQAGAADCSACVSCVRIWS